MSITSWEFYALLAATVLGLVVVPPGARKAVLLIASAAYYFGVDASSAAITLAVIFCNYLVLRALLGQTNETVRERIYLASVLFNVAVFVLLKLAFEPAPGAEARAWEIAGLAIGYPLGFSFVILMLHAAVTDAYSRKYVPTGKAGTFFLFAGFFPYVTAGPIERLEHMERQLDAPRRPGGEDIRAGLNLIALGLVKKLVAANRLEPYVDAVFAGNEVYSAGTVLLAIALNAAWVYCDFSAYTDIARGSARCLGIDVRINFDKPFAARSVTDFWRRWHISFSNWLRDYLFMPLAFTFGRWPRAGVSLALLITFLLCGFWHRATATFIAFGLLHGGAMALETRFAVTRRLSRLGFAGALVAHGYTLLFLALTILLFSATDLRHASEILERTVASPAIPSPTELAAYKGGVIFVLMVSSIAIWQAFEWAHRRLAPRHGVPFLLAAACAVLFMGKSGGADFVYAQF